MATIPKRPTIPLTRTYHRIITELEELRAAIQAIELGETIPFPAADPDELVSGDEFIIQRSNVLNRLSHEASTGPAILAIAEAQAAAIAAIEAMDALTAANIGVTIPGLVDGKVPVDLLPESAGLDPATQTDGSDWDDTTVPRADAAKGYIDDSFSLHLFADNPHGTAAVDIGLENVDNTSDLTKNTATTTLTNKTIGTGSSIDADVVAVTNLKTDNFKAGVLSIATDGAAASNTKIWSMLAAKTYIDSQVSAGFQPKTEVRAATVAAGTLATSFENGDTVDGVVLATGNRLLIKDQTAPAENGIYIVAASGAPTRATDMDAEAEVPGAFVSVHLGTANAGTSWFTLSEPTTLGTDGIVWQLQASSPAVTAGDGLVKSGSEISADLATTGDVAAKTAGKLPDASLVGIVGGLAGPLDGTGRLPAAQFPTNTVYLSGLIGGALSNKDYRIVLKSAAAFNITETTVRTASGSATITFKINSTALGGAAHLATTTEDSLARSSANAVAIGDDIVLTVSANVSGVDLSFAIKGTET